MYIIFHLLISTAFVVVSHVACLGVAGINAALTEHNTVETEYTCFSTDHHLQ